MADIMYLCESGALVDFSREDIASLVEKLFADSELRRYNINAILEGGNTDS